MAEETFQRLTISFYKYHILENPQEFRDSLFRNWFPLHCFGRIYVAREGINAQMSVPEHNFEAFLEILKKHVILNEIPIKYAIKDDGKSFYKLTIKVRPKLVADGLEDGTYDVTNVGKHLSGVEFHNEIGKENTVVVDMRNYYESEIGHFKGAICPEADTFREELEIVTDLLESKKDKKVLLYCTGGIRCEKASAYLKNQGFEDVNQLHGGILEYARQIKVENLDSKFMGKNFVFDERLGESVNGQVISKCHQCGRLATRIPIAKTWVVIFCLFSVLNAPKHIVDVVLQNVQMKKLVAKHDLKKTVLVLEIAVSFGRVYR